MKRKRRLHKEKPKSKPRSRRRRYSRRRRRRGLNCVMQRGRRERILYLLQSNVKRTV